MPKQPVISLFSGAGGLDLGFKLAGFDVAFAVDISPWAISTHRRNFPKAAAECLDMTEVGADELVRRIRDAVPPGTRVGVIGGPPCQGFSRANTSAVESDPRNKLPLLYLDIVARLQDSYDVDFVLFENVLGIRDKRHEDAFKGILSRLKELGFSERVDEFSALDFGVPQRRRRVIITGFKSDRARARFSPTPLRRRKNLSVRKAIESLPEPTFYSRDLQPETIAHHPNHWTMQPKSPKFRGASTSPGSRSFKRLEWDSPSPTVAYGHREIHVHPDGHRRLSIFEAMLLQGFPRDFVLHGPLSAQVEQVSNAVPPPLAKALAAAAARAIKEPSDALGS